MAIEMRTVEVARQRRGAGRSDPDGPGPTGYESRLEIARLAESLRLHAMTLIRWDPGVATAQRALGFADAIIARHETTAPLDVRRDDRIVTACRQHRAGIVVPAPLSSSCVGEAEQRLYDALRLEGEWTPDQLLAICRRLENVEWSRGNRLWKRFNYVAEVVRLSRHDILTGRYQIGPTTMVGFELDLGNMGLALGLVIPSIDPIAMGAYVLQRAGLRPGARRLRNHPLAELPDGLPLSRAVCSHLRRLPRFPSRRQSPESPGITTIGQLRKFARREANVTAFATLNSLRQVPRQILDTLTVLGFPIEEEREE